MRRGFLPGSVPELKRADIHRSAVHPRVAFEIKFRQTDGLQRAGIDAGRRGLQAEIPGVRVRPERLSADVPAARFKPRLVDVAVGDRRARGKMVVHLRPMAAVLPQRMLLAMTVGAR